MIFNREKSRNSHQNGSINNDTFVEWKIVQLPKLYLWRIFIDITKYNLIVSEK